MRAAGADDYIAKTMLVSRAVTIGPWRDEALTASTTSSDPAGQERKGSVP
jgi:hypothetical protein